MKEIGEEAGGLCGEVKLELRLLTGEVERELSGRIKKEDSVWGKEKQRRILQVPGEMTSFIERKESK